ncbi:MAG: dihydropyrimidinase [Planctomycetota bacterium]
MSLLIRGGTVVNADTTFRADVYCQGETITQIAASIDPASVQADRVVDATGKMIFPGFIDPHVHIYLPFMGAFAKDTYETASKAAVVGGTTTLIEMVCPARDDDPAEAYALWAGKAEGMSACDYGFHMGVTRFDDATEAALRRIVDQGTRSFKVFLAYKGAFGVTDDELYQVLKLAQELGVVVTAHCENAELVASLQAKLIGEGKTGPEWHEPSRPVRVEAEGVHHFCTFLEMTGASGYIVHTSCRDAVEAALAFRARGVDVDLETVIPYLTLDDTYAQRPDFEGAKFVMSPPIRSKDHQAYLWDALRAGHVATVATDHAPFDFTDQKDMGKPPAGNFTTIPNGIPSVEHRVNLLYTHGVKAGRLDLHRFVDAASTHAAKRFGMFPRKGAIQLGADADLVVWDDDYRGAISAKDHYMNTDYDGFEGFELQGRPGLVTVRGAVVAEDGLFTGKIGHGRLAPRG